ncbi:MAG: alpha-amylase family glycosyl hydrolase [Bacillota bacterium]|nr:alpha-amylase family glycosyl hydrolase [Bacillota bacterium]
MSKWLDNAVFYEIYPQSFKDSNADGIGDIQGIIQKLDYIQDLGCNAIWLNPCFVSPFADAGYDVADYFNVAPRYGTNDDLKELFDKLHERNMHVILDLVPGHTSIAHPWFKESMKAEKNEYTHRYIWTDSIWEGFEGVSSIAGCIRGISDRDGSCAVNFFSTQPALNYGFAKPEKSWQFAVDSEEAMAAREAIKEVMSFWLNLGCDGFRVDMAGSLVKNDIDSRETIKLWQNFRAFLDMEFPEAVLISEWGEPDKSLLGGFHMDFLLHFGPSHYLDLFRSEHPYFSKEGKGDISEFVHKYMENYKLTDGKGLICIPSGNHDMVRIAHKLDEEELKIAFAFLLTMPGVPFIYYGDEIGMKYVENLTSVEGGYGRTGSRSPMQWDNSLNAGFSTGRKEDLYIMLDPREERPNVKTQSKREDSLCNEVKRLICLRLANKPLCSRAPVEFLYAKENAYPFVYRRIGDKESILVVLNPSKEQADCRVMVDPACEAIYSTNGVASIDNGSITAPPCSVTIFKIS